MKRAFEERLRAAACGACAQAYRLRAARRRAGPPVARQCREAPTPLSAGAGGRTRSATPIAAA
ncbi:hypothetical protein, partial [Burkholderia multivorans]|uniref:hypothetical protein n=1 Tax=Burkholderia multivorans TaxID=87883 RepID=UPI00286FD7DE